MSAVDVVYRIRVALSYQAVPHQQAGKRGSNPRLGSVQLLGKCCAERFCVFCTNEGLGASCL